MKKDINKQILTHKKESISDTISHNHCFIQSNSNRSLSRPDLQEVLCSTDSSDISDESLCKKDINLCLQSNNYKTNNNNSNSYNNLMCSTKDSCATPSTSSASKSALSSTPSSSVLLSFHESFNNHPIMVSCQPRQQNQRLLSGELSSPSSTCFQRSLSSVLVTNPEHDHELMKGRPKQVVVTPLHQNASSNDGDNNNTTLSCGSSHRLSLVRSSTCILDTRLTDFVCLPPPLRLEAWSEPSACHYNVRSAGYTLNNGRKGLKGPSEESVFKLLTVDLVKSIQPNFGGMCAHPNERIQLALAKEKQYGIVELPEFIFAVNLCVPSSPGKYYHHCVFYYGLDNIELIRNTNTPLGRVAHPFFFGTDDEYRNRTFKLIPKIIDGNYIVKKAVGSKPTILGSKLKQYYIQNDRYFELVIDIGSDTIANSVVKLALGYAKSLIVDMMFVLEGHDESMLPERILGGVQMKHIDFKCKDGQRTCLNPM